MQLNKKVEPDYYCVRRFPAALYWFLRDNYEVLSYIIKLLKRQLYL